MQVAKKSHLAEQLSSVYDCYLEIIRAVDARVQQALGRDQKWKSLNVCPPCMYKLEDEPPMKFSMLATMDGNNSLKLVDNTFKSGLSRIDDRMSTSSRWITPEDVDRFKDEVGNSLKKVKFLLIYTLQFYLYKFSHRKQLMLITLLRAFQGHQACLKAIHQPYLTQPLIRMLTMMILLG